MTLKQGHRFNWPVEHFQNCSAVSGGTKLVKLTQNWLDPEMLRPHRCCHVGSPHLSLRFEQGEEHCFLDNDVTPQRRLCATRQRDGTRTRSFANTWPRLKRKSPSLPARRTRLRKRIKASWKSSRPH